MFRPKEVWTKLSKTIQSYPKLSKAIQSYPMLSKAIQNYPELSKAIQNYPELSVSAGEENLSLVAPRAQAIQPLALTPT